MHNQENRETLSWLRFSLPARLALLGGSVKKCAMFTAILTLWLWTAAVNAQEPPPSQDYSSFVGWMRAHHKAPFPADPGRLMSKEKRVQLEKSLIARIEANKDKARKKDGRNVKVNQDRNPWSKVRISQAVDPSEPSHVAVLSNDFREPSERVFYHFSTNHGKEWTDDSIPTGIDDFTGGASFNFSRDASASYDQQGNEYIIQVGGNGMVDFQFDYGNSDTDLQLLLGASHGAYHAIVPFNVQLQQCSGPIGFGLPAMCDGFIASPSLATDTSTSSPLSGTSYASYTLFCNFPISSACNVNGLPAVPAGGSAILAIQFKDVLANGWTSTGVASGTHTNVQYSDVAIDASGTPHIFFDDFTDPGNTTMWESTFTNGAWVVSSQPVATFTLASTSNSNWVFPINEAAAPGCGTFKNTAYCAFSASHIAGGPTEATESVYVAKVDLTTGTSTITRVNNDAFGNGKDHLFAWATTVPSGAVYVGWYDDRNDPANVKAEYFVAKSTDGALTFPTQMAVSDESFDPCVAAEHCGYFGGTTQLVAGPDGVVHAAWSDGRDGVSLQIWSQTVRW